MCKLFLGAFFLIFFQFNALASCQVYIPVKEFNHYGYVINFDFTAMLYDKKYVEVKNPEEADYEITIEGREQQGTFHRAVAIIQMGEYKAEESVLCLTQACSLGDYAKAFNKSYKKLGQKIPVCQTF